MRGRWSGRAMRVGIGYIVVGEWIDRNWHDLAKKVPPLDDAELAILFAGPRAHPFGPEFFATTAPIGGKTMIFRSKAEHDRYVNSTEEDSA